MKYRRLFDELVQHALDHGIMVTVVPSSVCQDFMGMNSETAKQLGFKMPPNTIYVANADEVKNTNGSRQYGVKVFDRMVFFDEDEWDKVRYKTLCHEADEMGLVPIKGKYWPAHVESRKKEKLHNPQRMQGVITRYVKRKKRKPTLGTVR
jgi:hypothetical protein